MRYKIIYQKEQNLIKIKDFILFFLIKKKNIK
jgi:hypothetical protein